MSATAYILPGSYKKEVSAILPHAFRKPFLISAQ